MGEGRRLPDQVYAASIIRLIASSVGSGSAAARAGSAGFASGGGSNSGTNAAVASGRRR
jgi:hypothetical protein